MSWEFSAPGVLQKGALLLRDRAAFEAGLAAFRDGEVTITVRRMVATRSAKANRYYWSVIVKRIAAHTGYTPEETHTVLKQKFLPRTLAVLTEHGDIVDEVVIGGTTTTLTREEFDDYCSQIRLWALEFLKVDVSDDEGGAPC